MASVENRNGSYHIRCYCGTDSRGKRINKHLVWTPEEGMTQRQIERELSKQIAEFENRCEQGLTVNSKMTLENYVNNIWLDRVRNELKPTTFKRYQQLLSRILPALGHYKMCLIQPAHLYSFYDDLREEKRDDTKYIPNEEAKRLSRTETRPELAKNLNISVATVDSIRAGKSVSLETAEKFAKYFNASISRVFDAIEQNICQRTILHHHRLLSTIMQSAVYDSVIQSNPCQRTRPPKVDQKEAKYLDDEQAERLVELVQEKAPHPFDVIIILILQTGMRRGEACGLEWNDIDFDNCTISISRTLMYLPKIGVFENDPKTNSSRRVIKVGEDVIEMLSDFREWQDKEAERLGDYWQESGKVFTAVNGKPINPGTVTAWFHDFTQHNDLPPVSIHGLRHTNASLMISSGVPITTTAKRLGHSTSATTSRIYAHAIASADAAAASMLQSVLPIKRNKRT